MGTLHFRSFFFVKSTFAATFGSNLDLIIAELC